MSLQRSNALNIALLVGAALLLTVPLAVGPDVAPDRVEFSVEGDWADRDGQQTLVYEDLSPAEQSVFDEAQAASPETVTVAAASAPERLTPHTNGIELYNVHHGDEVWLLQAKHRNNSADFLTQVLPRLVLGMSGILLGILAGYREFA